MSRRTPHILTLVVIVLVLVACGGDSTPEPTAPAAPPTPEPGQMTVADLVALADASWLDVDTMRMTSRSSLIASQDEQAFNGSIQDWTANGNRHIVEFQDGAAINEQIYADGVIYMRGVFVSAAIAPGLNVNTWVIVDEASFDPDSQVTAQITYLTREQTNPYGVLTEDVLQSPVKNAGRVTVGDRSCTLYTFGDDANTGNEIRYEIAIDDGGLPCQVVQRAGNSQNSTVYEFNTGIDVRAPLEGTPEAASPEA